MQVIKADRLNRRVTFEKDEMQFTMHKGEVCAWVARKPNYLEYRKAKRQYYAIINF